LPTLLEQLGIQEPTRGRLVQLNPPLEYVVAWYLYAGQEPGLQRPLPYVVNRLTAGDPPPDPYLRLARLERDKWRQFAAAYHFRHQLPLDQWQPFTDDSSDFNLWLDYFAAVPLEDLPFDIGLNLQPPEAPPPPAEAQAPPATPAAASSAAASSAAVSEADQQIWRETCRALRGQMDPATFNAWLRDATLLKRAGPLFTIGVRNEAARQWVAGRLLSPIRLTLTALTGHPIDLEVTINSHDAILSSGDTSLRQPTFRT
jgi:hypothetical protein